MRHVADLLADVVKLAGAEDRDFAARRLVESRQRAQQCRLAGAVVAQNGVEFAAGEIPQ